MVNETGRLPLDQNIYRFPHGERQCVSFYSCYTCFQNTAREYASCFAFSDSHVVHQNSGRLGSLQDSGLFLAHIVRTIIEGGKLNTKIISPFPVQRTEQSCDAR